jgi:hypothetical protein
MGELNFQAQGWSAPRRIVVVRQHTVQRKNTAGKTMSLFADDPDLQGWRYGAMATTLNCLRWRYGALIVVALIAKIVSRNSRRTLVWTASTAMIFTRLKRHWAYYYWRTISRVYSAKRYCGVRCNIPDAASRGIFVGAF